MFLALKGGCKAWTETISLHRHLHRDLIWVYTAMGISCYQMILKKNWMKLHFIHINWHMQSKKYSLIQISTQPITWGSKGLHHLQISLFVQILGHDTSPGTTWLSQEYSGYSLLSRDVPRCPAVASLRIPKLCWSGNKRGKPSSELCWDCIWKKGFVCLCLRNDLCLTTRSLIL